MSDWSAIRQWWQGRAKRRWSRQRFRDFYVSGNLFPSYVFTVRDFPRGISLGRQFADDYMLGTLQRHGPHADHCSGYDVAAWPCMSAKLALTRYICEYCGADRPCAIHDWAGDGDGFTAVAAPEPTYQPPPEQAANESEMRG